MLPAVIGIDEKRGVTCHLHNITAYKARMPCQHICSNGKEAFLVCIAQSICPNVMSAISRNKMTVKFWLPFIVHQNSFTTECQYISHENSHQIPYQLRDAHSETLLNQGFSEALKHVRQPINMPKEGSYNC